MTREFTPGDVVLDPDQTGAARVALVVSPHFSGCPSAHREYGVHVHYGDGDWNALKDRFLPLVVIDPEDMEAVERLLGGYYHHVSGGNAEEEDYSDLAERMQAALREYANPKPPKPDEPQGLYARVEDADGRIWVRTALQASVWRRESVNSGGFRYLIPQDGCEDYDRIAAVRVLSPGVEVDQ